jgi:hypothetical protein
MQEFTVIAVGFVILALTGVDFDGAAMKGCIASLANTLSADCGSHDLP